MKTETNDRQLILKNCRYLNVFSNAFEDADILIENGVIREIGDISESGQDASCHEVDLGGKYVVPGFVNSHMHFESSIIRPSEYAKLALTFGTTTVIADPHEICNVAGEKGLEFMLKETEGLPFDAFFMLPSCVPASPFDESGCVLDSAFVEKYIGNPRILGLAEVMNYPGVIAEDPDLMRKLEITKKYGKRIDGHAPKLSGEPLQRYAGAGIRSEHECTALDEALEKLRLGIRIMIREGNASKDLQALIPLLNASTYERCMFATDDIMPGDLGAAGDISHLVEMALSGGVDPVTVYKTASYNAAAAFGLTDRGAIAPGYIADLVVLEELKQGAIYQVYKNGILQAENNRLLHPEVFDKKGIAIGPEILCSVNLSDIRPEQLRTKHEQGKIIRLIPDTIITENGGEAAGIDVSQDILKLCVVERHHNTGHVGICYVQGYGLKAGAIAASIAHDSHNIVVIGTNDADIILAIRHMKEMNGGLLIAENSQIVGELALPIAGLMCTHSGNEVQASVNNMIRTAHEMGVHENVSPFMALSFLALPVIPKWKLTTMGVVDVERFALVEDF